MSAAEARQVLLQGLFDTIDAQDTDRFVGFLTPDAAFRFGSAPTAVGRDAIHEAVSGFFGTVKSLEHALTKSMEHGNTIVCEGDVTYTRHDDSTVTLPFANVFEVADDGLIAEYKIYMDIGPLYSA